MGNGSCSPPGPANEARATFGPSASGCNLGEYTVLIWNNNLLGYLGRQP